MPPPFLEALREGVQWQPGTAACGSMEQAAVRTMNGTPDRSCNLWNERARPNKKRTSNFTDIIGKIGG